MATVEVEIDAKVLFQMYEYAAYAKHHFNSEIAGWAHYSEKRGIYKLAPLLKQIVSGAEVDTFPNEILDDVKYDMSDLVVQWHSHADMSCSPSATDRKLIEEALELFPMFISIIVNCKHEYSAQLSVRSVGRGKAQFQLPSKESWDVNLFPYYSNGAVSKEVLAKCKKPEPVVVISSGKSIGFTSEKKHYYVNGDGTYGYWSREQKAFVPLIKNYNKLVSKDKAVIEEQAKEKEEQPSPPVEEDMFLDWDIPLNGDGESERESLKAFVNQLVAPQDAEPFIKLMVKAKLLEESDKKRFHCYYDSNRVSFMVTDNTTNNHLYVDPWLTEINGITVMQGAWEEFLTRVGCAKEPFLLEKIVAGG